MTISKKYNMLHPELLQRICEETPDLKAAKTRLHQLYGAYVNESSHKKAAALLAQRDYDAILRLHASTRERLPHYPEICNFIKSHTGEDNIKTILDLGCGFNPFALHFWRLPALTAYHACDIDTRTAALLNSFFEIHGLPQTAECADLIAETPAPTADIVLIFKLLPVLEAQKVGRGYELLREVEGRFVVVSYPLKSLGGRSKGMERNYSAGFMAAVGEGRLGDKRLIAEARVGDELIYVLKLNPAYPSH